MLIHFTQKIKSNIRALQHTRHGVCCHYWVLIHMISMNCCCQEKPHQAFYCSIEEPKSESVTGTFLNITILK